MLTAPEIRALLVCRLSALAEETNRTRIVQMIAECKALVAVLTNGHPPTIKDNDFAAAVLDAARIPYTRNGDALHWKDAWLREHGFLVRYDQASKMIFTHPQFACAW